jgi:hypothetical protein
MISFLGCSRRKLSQKIDIPPPIPKPTEYEDIEVQTIDASQILEPPTVVFDADVSSMTKMALLPGQSDDYEEMRKEMLKMSVVDIINQGKTELALQVINPEYVPKAPKVQEAQEDPVVEEKPKRFRVARQIYNHKFWPSPRAAHWVRYMRKNLIIPYQTWEGRLTHEKALDALAFHIDCSVDELLLIEPLDYLKKLNFTEAQITKFMPLVGSRGTYV